MLLRLIHRARGGHSAMHARSIRRALLSVSDKTGLIDFPRGLAAVTDPAQYAAVLGELQAHDGALELETREQLAAAAFARTAAYDRAISAYFAGRHTSEIFPPALDLRFERKLPLRYGENPHQQA